MKLFVWDFHGVLEQGNDRAVYEISNSVLKEFKYAKRFSMNDCERLNGLKWYQYFEEILPDLDHSEHLRLQERCFDISNNQPEIVAKYIKATTHSHKVLRTLSQKHEQVLISNTKPRSLEMYLQATRLKRFFGSGNAIAVDAHRKVVKESKKTVFQKFINRTMKIQFERVVIIGDSPGDIELSEVMGLENTTTYLYSHPGKNFREGKADFYINDLRELLKEF